jgi:hypothetical protein
MMAHELLRQAAQILGAGWSKGASARDATGRIVPLWAELLRQAAQILGEAGPKERALVMLRVVSSRCLPAHNNWRYRWPGHRG